VFWGLGDVLLAVIVLIGLGKTVRIGVITVWKVVIIRIGINVRVLRVIIRVIGVLH
jgi:hypothetical protein